MLDDIVIAGLAPSSVRIGWIPPGFQPSTAARKAGKPPSFIRKMAGGSIIITYTPLTRVVEVRVSVPKWLSKHRLVNYPLCELPEGVENLRLKSMAVHIHEAFGLPRRDLGYGGERVWPLRRWAVVKATFAADLTVLDALLVVGMLRGLQRKWTPTPISYGNETVMWKGGSLTAKFYCKGKQIENERRRHHQPQQREKFDRLAYLARNIVRFEVTYGGVKPLRRLLATVFKLPKLALPTLTLIARPEVSAWALGVEVERLGLRNHQVGVAAESEAMRVMKIMAAIDEAQRQVNAKEQRLSRTERGSMTSDYANQLLFARLVLPGLSVSKAVKRFGWSESSVREWLRDLKLLGLAPDLSESGNLASIAQQVLAALEPHLLPQHPPDPQWFHNLTRAWGRCFAWPPWSEQAPEEQADEDETPDEEQAWAVGTVDFSGVIDLDGGQGQDDDPPGSVDVQKTDPVAVNNGDECPANDEHQTGPIATGDEGDFPVNEHDTSLDEWEIDPTEGEFMRVA